MVLNQFSLGYTDSARAKVELITNTVTELRRCSGYSSIAAEMSQNNDLVRTV